MRKFFLTATLTCLFVPAYADAPFMSESAEPLSTGASTFILYSSGNWSKTVNTLVAPALEIDYGVIPNLEIDGYFPILRNYDADAGVKEAFPNDSGLGDISIEIKYRFFQETTYLPEIAFAPTVYLPTGNGNRGLGSTHFRRWRHSAAKITSALSVDCLCGLFATPLSELFSIPPFVWGFKPTPPDNGS